MTTRRRTLDLASQMAEEARQHPVYTVEELGPNRRLLPNGNLLCMNVPLARVGWLIYGPGEVPVKPGQNGVSYVERTADALFNETTMGSFMGAAVVDDHPPVDVDPSNYEKFAGGFVLNVRRGEGEDSDVLLGDLMVTRKSTIDAILRGKIEVSAGYDADYTDLGQGAGKQFNLIGNHIALVEKGRCGPRCAIGDHAYQPPAINPQGEPAMATVKHRGPQRRATIDEAGLAVLRQRAQDAVADLAAAETGDLGDADSEGIHVHIHNGADDGTSVRTGDAATVDRIAALEEGMDTLTTLVEGIATALKTRDAKADPVGNSDAPADDPGTGNTAKKNRKNVKGKPADGSAQGTTDADNEEDDEDGDDDGANSTRDSAALHTSYMEVVSQAEVLVPGFKVPTFDAAAKRATTVDRMCTSRKLCLSQFATTDSGRAMLLGLNAGQELDVVSMDCGAAATLFKGAAGAQAALNNIAATSGAHRTGDAKGGIVAGGYKAPPTLAEINDINRKFWEGK